MEKGGINMTKEEKVRAICRHFETKDKKFIDRCWAAAVHYDMNGSVVVEFMTCPHQGNIQKCLDELLQVNEYGIIWKQHIADTILRGRKAIEEGFEIQKKENKEKSKDSKQTRSGTLDYTDLWE
jgi:hypothetical protein